MSTAKYLCIVLLVFVAHPAYLQLQPQSGCSYLNNAFQQFCTRESLHRMPSRPVQGPPGKRGAIGEKGEKGNRGIAGPVAEVNYTLIDASIQEGIRQAMNSYLAARTEVNTRITQLEEKKDVCPLNYDGKCFWMEVGEQEITCDEAKALCKLREGTPANVYSRDHYYMMFGYVKALMRPNHVTHVWLGMTYDTQNRRALLSDGTAAPFVVWHPGYPNREWCCCIGFQVRTTSYQAGQHLLNRPVGSARRAVICEK